MVGNENALRQLSADIAAGRFPHALLIEGPAGCGKKTLARQLAMAAVCENTDSRPCGVCNPCRKVEQGIHPDVEMVTGGTGSSNSFHIDRIRELRDGAYVLPNEAAVRVLILCDAHTMTPQAQNALLKILEEPPKNVFFILITESQEALLPTTLSRCITFKLSPPKRSKALKWILENVKPKREEDVILKALDDANGNIGRTAELLRKRNSDSPESIAKEFANLLFTGDEFDMLALLNKFEKDRPKADIFLASLKYEMTLLLRKNYSDTKKAKLLTELYSLCDRFQISLNTNINLALLFAEIVSTIKKLQRDYLN